MLCRNLRENERVRKLVKVSIKYNDWLIFKVSKGKWEEGYRRLYKFNFKNKKYFWSYKVIGGS